MASFWLIKTGEAPPLEGFKGRLYRVAALSRALISLGHEVTYWTSTFDHARKTHLVSSETELRPEPGLTLKLLHRGGYKGNVSVQRIAHHRALAAAFRAQAPLLPKPDLVMSCMPTIEFADAATAFAAARGIPSVVDVRDLWPDIIVNRVPPALQPIARLGVLPLEHALRRSLRRAKAVTAVGEPMLEWALKKAGRERGPLDRTFRSAYDRPDPSSLENLDQEVRDWRDAGVDLSGPRKILPIVSSLNVMLGFEDFIGQLDAFPAAIRNAVQVVICGAGAMETVLRREAQAREWPHVTIAGHVSQRRLIALLRASWVAIHPYPNRFDFLTCAPNKIGEYLAYGLPILYRVQGDVHQILQESGCGVFFDETQPDGLALQIDALLNDPGRVQGLRDRARTGFLENFEARAVYDRFADLLESIAGTGTH